eukprot:UN30990
MYFPRDLKTYIHRVGRTARIGKRGNSVTLVGDNHKEDLKKLVAEAKKRGETVKGREIDNEKLKEAVEHIEKITPQIKETLQLEKEEKELRKAELEANRGLNRIKHEAEIFSRPKRTWFKNE